MSQRDKMIRSFGGRECPLPAAFGVMNGLGLRCFSMNKSKRAETPAVRTTKLSIGGMTCGACVHHVTRALDGLPGVVHVDVDLQEKKALVEHLPNSVDEVSLVAAIKDAGYQAKVVATATEPSGVVPPAPSISRSTGCCCGPRQQSNA